MLEEEDSTRLEAPQQSQDSDANGYHCQKLHELSEAMTKACVTSTSSTVNNSKEETDTTITTNTIITSASVTSQDTRQDIIGDGTMSMSSTANSLSTIQQPYSTSRASSPSYSQQQQQSFESTPSGINPYFSSSRTEGGVDKATARLIQLVETKSHTDVTFYDKSISESMTNPENERENTNHPSSHDSSSSIRSSSNNNTTSTQSMDNSLYVYTGDGIQQNDTACTPLDELVEAATRPTFQTYSSDTNIHDPPDPPYEPPSSELHTIRSYDLEDSPSSPSSSKLSSPRSTKSVTFHHHHHLNNNNNNNDHNSTNTNNDNDANESSSENTSSANSLGSKVYKITNTETGEVYDIRDLERIGSKESSAGFEIGYSLFPSKGDLIEMQSRRLTQEDLQSLDGEVKRSPIKERGKKISNMIKKSLRRIDDTKQSEVDNPMPTITTPTANTTTDEGNDLTVDQEKMMNHDTPPTSPKLSPTKKENRNSLRQRNKSMTRKKNAPVLLPPRNTLPVKSVNKPHSQSDFHPLLLISTITKAHDGPIWRSEFSKDGKYLATGGMDGVLNIWEVAPTHTSSSDHEMKEGEIDALWKGQTVKDDRNDGKSQFEEPAPPLGTVNSPCPSLGTEVKILSSEPIQRFTDHTRDIVDISWSHSNFVLSASLDKYVRLWNPTRKVCLRMFHHADVVTAVSFHPNNDQYFLSGGFDRKIRIWSILDGRVKEWAQAPNIISTATFQPDGQYIAAGMFDGKVIFYSVDGIKLKYFTQINCKNRRSKHGKKVTGLSFLQNLSADKVVTAVSSPTAQKRKINIQTPKFMKSFAQRKKKQVKQQVLVTTNDSRLRLVGLNDFCMVRKYKGLTNASLQIKARFSESGEFIICGSESRNVYVWNTATKRNPLHVNVTGINMYDKVKNHECFEGTKADPPIITEALFAPENSVKTAFLSSGLFPKLYSVEHINHDMTSAVIVTTDYEGTMRVFLRRACLDAVCHAAGPSGFK